MNIKFDFDENLNPVNFRLVAGSESENNILNAFTFQYGQVENPVLGFAEDAKMGYYDKYSDEQYKKIVDSYKKLSYLFKKNGNIKSSPCGSANIFEILISLLNYYFLDAQEKENNQQILCNGTKEQEEILLCALLVDLEGSKMLRKCLTVDHFSDPSHAILFDIISAESAMSEEKLPDINTVAIKYAEKTGCSKKQALMMLQRLLNNRYFQKS